MALSKLTFLNHLKLLVGTHHHHQTLRPAVISVRRHLSSSTPEDVSALTGKRLLLHNRILELIRKNDLQEASLLTRRSFYSNCKPTIFTINTVMAACLRKSKYEDVLNLHYFIDPTGIASNIVGYNLIIKTYMACRKPNYAMRQYKRLIDYAPFDPIPTTYRLVVKGLLDNDKLEKALEVKDDMISKGLKADPTVYSYLMSAQAKNGNPDQIFNLYEELKEKLGGFVRDGVVYGSVMEGYFLKGMEKEAMECFEEALADDSKIKMRTMAYNNVLDTLSRNGKFDDALKLFDEMLTKHNPPIHLTVYLGSYNVMVDGYCAEKRFDEAINIFNNMAEKGVHPDTLSFNNLIEQLCNNGLLAKAEEVYNSITQKQVTPDKFTFIVLIYACFKEDRPDDAVLYFKNMIESKVKPDLTVYNRLMGGLVKVGKVDEAKSFFDMMAPKLKMDDDNYKFMMKALFDIKKHDEVLEMIGKMLWEEPLDFSDELEVFVREELKKEDREDDLGKLMEDVEREKAAVAAKKAEEAKREIRRRMAWLPVRR